MKKTHSNSVILLIIAAVTFCSPLFGQYTNRDSWQQPERIMDAVGIVSGMTIGEAGAGDGYLTFYLSKRVGPKGRVYANDINRNALRTIERRCERENIENITTIVGEVADPLFPENELDVVIMLRAFHEFDRPVEWIKNVIPSMKEGAKMVIVDLEPSKARYGWNHFMTREQILAIMEKTDFNLVRIDEFLQQDNIYLFELKEEVADERTPQANF
ncbi:class I SAM-dependent methyltransferase [bacterium]|nr:class I SAM-dependent methyltransferase [bacterium]RQV94093.1 MAG: class I SAM-dependent methyltransferase [bacterium]